MNSPYKRKCWTNSGGPLVNSVLWDYIPEGKRGVFYFFKRFLPAFAAPTAVGEGGVSTLCFWPVLHQKLEGTFLKYLRPLGFFFLGRPQKNNTLALRTLHSEHTGIYVQIKYTKSVQSNNVFSWISSISFHWSIMAKSPCLGLGYIPNVGEMTTFAGRLPAVHVYYRCFKNKSFSI